MENPTADPYPAPMKKPPRSVPPLFPVAALLIAMTTAACPDDEPPPGVSDLCFPAPEPVEVDALEVGLGDGLFAPIEEDQILPLEYGGQGFAMLELLVRVRGDSIPDCLPQTTFGYDRDGEIVADLTGGLGVYRGDDGWYQSKTLWLILYPSIGGGERMRLHTQAGNRAFERWIFLDFQGPDAGVPDAAAVDAGSPEMTDAGP